MPHHHRDQDDRHVLVRPLPPHHVRHRVGRRADRGRGRARGLRALSGDAPRAGPRREARVPHGHGHHWGALAEGAGHPDRSGRVRGDQRLHREGEGGRGRGRSGLAVPVQERDAQPSHRDRALRRCGHLRGRRHPRPLERAQLRVPGHAPHRRGRPAGARVRDAARQAAATQAGDHGGRRLFVLRQPDRLGNGPGERAVPPRLRGQAHGDRRRGRRHAGRPRASRDACAGRRDRASGRAHRPRRHRRRDGFLEGARAGVARDVRGRGAEGQRAGRAQDPAPVPPRRRMPAHQALQRLRRRRRVGGRGRAGGRPVHRPEQGSEEVRGPGRHRAGHRGKPGAHGRGAGARGRGRVPALRARREPGGHAHRRGHRRGARAHGVERRHHR